MAIPQLGGKWVLVTGAAAGIGYETALAFAREGASLVICDLEAQRLDACATELTEIGAKYLRYGFDVADEAAVHQLADTLQARIGVPDVIVNNAGIGYLGPYDKTSTATWRRVLDINLMGVVHGCQAFVPRMREAGGARHVVNLASAAGYSAVPNLSAYVASKHAVMGFTETLAMELHGSSVGVSVVCPGIINTAIVRNAAQVSEAIRSEQTDRLQAYYQAHGAHPSLVAQRIVRAVKRGENLVLAGPTARSAYFAKRLSPSLLRAASLVEAKKTGYL